ncbi:conserved protein of unknown function (plasmid) [Thermococcus nautili]|uniref:hypothetical protein n=1 Tax=Thermococcus nautili TaxID=195522 RepID=UPI002552413F|nr:hypothetical protein [Thermococcus nautili]CAI1494170.1 conserved protein of unknown function [Thermococcus nautili]
MRLADLIVKYGMKKGPEINPRVIGMYAKKKNYKAQSLRLIGFELGQGKAVVRDGKIFIKVQS